MIEQVAKALHCDFASTADAKQPEHEEDCDAVHLEEQ